MTKTSEGETVCSRIEVRTVNCSRIFISRPTDLGQWGPSLLDVRFWYWRVGCRVERGRKTEGTRSGRSTLHMLGVLFLTNR